MRQEIEKLLNNKSIKIDYNNKKLAIILAAGHGKRIKSETSKMLHQIWGKSSVLRVAEAVKHGLNTTNIVFVLGIKADEVLETITREMQGIFVFQEEQLGTGHAVQIAFEQPEIARYEGEVYIFPGDIGLLKSDLVKDFSMDFENSNDDMNVLTADFQGNPVDNYYGRIVRTNSESTLPESLKKKVVAIKEFKDIFNSKKSDQFKYSYHGFELQYTREELLNLSEFNTGIYAFTSNTIKQYLKFIQANNIQKEIYLTDLIEIYNQNKKKVGAFRIKEQTQVLGFNVKSVLKQMNDLYRTQVYSKLKDIITIHDRDHFYIDDDVVEQIINMDKEHPFLDIEIGYNVYIGKGVQLARNVKICDDANLIGHIKLNQGVIIGENCSLSNYEGQTIELGKNVFLIGNSRIKGVVSIGDNSRIESNVRITGNDQFPVKIGQFVTIKGTTYLFGTIVEDGILIEHCVLKLRRLEAVERKDGQIQPFRYILPAPEGMDSLRGL